MHLCVCFLVLTQSSLVSQCGPCRSFTPQLVKTYNQLKKDGKDFEIIFVSSDRKEDNFKEYFETMPWLALPFNDQRCKKLSQRFEVSGMCVCVGGGGFRCGSVQ